MITFNPKIKLVLADVDETVADVYTKATPEMIRELNSFIREGRAMFLISGGGLQSIRERIVDFLDPEIRHKVLIAHCMGAEVWGFQNGGEINAKPFYSLYEGHFSESQKETWRSIINALIEKFHLQTYSTRPQKEFTAISEGDPKRIMLADRGAQITFEFVNSTNLSESQKEQLEKELQVEIPLMHGEYDLRYPILEEAHALYTKYHLPIKPQFGGMFALDHIIEGVDKTRAVRHVLEDEAILNTIGLSKKDIQEAAVLEIWGDKYIQKKGGPDFAMCRAVSPKVRAIDFRNEPIEEIPTGYNIQLWDGKKHLHEGLLEYLENRHNL